MSGKKEEVVSNIDDAKLDQKEGKRVILKVIDKKENLEDKNKTGDNIEVFPNPSEPIISEGVTVGNFRPEVDYDIEDLCKGGLVADDDVKTAIVDLDIFKLLNTLDKGLNESFGHYGDINILFSRSAKDVLRESALVEYKVFESSFLLGLNLLEGSKNNVKVVIKSSYGKDLMVEECKKESASNCLQTFFEAIYLREKFKRNLTESLDADHLGEIMADVNQVAKKLNVVVDYDDKDEKSSIKVIFSSQDIEALEKVRKYILDTYEDMGSEVSEIQDGKFILG